MKRRLLLLGYTGKMGLALQEVFRHDWEIIGHNATTLDAGDAQAVVQAVTAARPDLVINTIAFMGIEACEKNPALAMGINALFPRQLAQLSEKLSFPLIHFSSDAVFDDQKKGPYLESDCPHPINMYGVSKYGGDCLVARHAPRHYLFRLPILFGPSLKAAQFVEKMLARVSKGESSLTIAADILASPSYSLDLAAGVKQVIQEEKPWGLYHLCNSGQGSLYDLMKEIQHHLAFKTEILPASHTAFSTVGEKNTYTVMASEKLPPLRPWREAVADYCRVWGEAPKTPNLE